MNKLLFGSLILPAGILASIASVTIPVLEMKNSGPITAVSPLMSDSLTAQGNKYSKINLLSEKYGRKAFGNNVTLKANPDSTFTIPRPEKGEEIHIFQTDIKSDRYTKGKLKIGSDAIFEIIINGESKLKKDCAQDSLTADSYKSVDLILEPERKTEITVKILTSSESGNKSGLRMEFIPDADYTSASVEIKPELKHRFLLESTVLGTKAASTSVSPDGKYMIITFVSRPDTGTRQEYSNIIDTRTGKTIAYNLPAGSAWMPSGSTLYHTLKSKDGFDLYTTTVPSMYQELKYSGLPKGSGFDWAPDASYIIYSDIDEGETPKGPLRRYTSPDDRIPGNRSRSNLKIYWPESGNGRTLTFGHTQNLLADISADSRKILILSPRETPSQHTFYLMDLLQMDVVSMQTDTLIKDNGFIQGAQYSPDAKKIFITGSPRTFGNLGVNAGDQPIVNDFDAQGFIFDIASGDVKAVTKNFNPSIKGQPVWNRKDGNIYFSGLDGFARRLYKINSSDYKIQEIPTEPQNVMSFSMGTDENSVIGYIGEGYTYAGRAYTLNLKNGKSTLTANPLEPELENIEFGKSEQWTFTADDGTLIDGTMTLPPDFDPDKKYPLLVYYYGGTSPSEYMSSHPYVPQLYASRGYVVYVVNPSGTYGYGQEFSARHVNAWGKRTADDIIQGVKKFCKDHPFVNDKKIGCFGASYGGFMTQYLQTVTDIFAAAVSHAGISNVASYWGEGYWGYSYNSVAAAESYPWNNPELFTQQGSLFNADKINTPLLLLHGTADTNVPIGESIQLFNALRILGKDVEFISVADEDHVSGGFPWEKRLLWQNTIMAWFDKYLKDQPQWWNSMYPDSPAK